MRKFLCLALVASAALLAAGDHTAGGSYLGAPADVVPANQPSASGMVVQIDPVTGLATEPTPEGMRDLRELQNRMGAFNNSSDGLTEVPSTVVGGGYVVDLQGRFQHSLTVTIDASGAAHSSCNVAPSTSSHSASGEVSSSCADH